MSVEEIQKLVEKTFIAGIETGLKINGATIRIKNESDVAQFTRLGNGKTLLKELNYHKSNVVEQPVKITWGTKTVKPDFGLSIGKQNVAVLDVKSPQVKIDDYTSQILSYCREWQCPFGILFNGKSVRMYVNTLLIPRLRNELREFFKDRVVFGADISIPNTNCQSTPARKAELQHMARILFEISKPKMSGDAIIHARNLINSRWQEMEREAADTERILRIKKRLEYLKSNPTNQMLNAIKSSDLRLKNERPSTGELKELWSKI